MAYWDSAQAEKSSGFNMFNDVNEFGKSGTLVVGAGEVWTGKDQSV
jgi:hypothetical protein